eukprot:260840-Lingulodinium_polyedra.AAC.1
MIYMINSVEEYASAGSRVDAEDVYASRGDARRAESCGNAHRIGVGWRRCYSTRADNLEHHRLPHPPRSIQH